MENELLTRDEHLALKTTGDLWEQLQGIIGTGPTTLQDALELATHIHAIQNTILAQAAARRYPDKYRLLGQTLRRNNHIEQMYDDARLTDFEGRY